MQSGLKVLIVVAVCLLLLVGIQVQSQTPDRPMTAAELSAAQSSIAGEWNIALCYPPQALEHRGLPGWYSLVALDTIIGNGANGFQTQVAARATSEGVEVKAFDPLYAEGGSVSTNNYGGVTNDLHFADTYTENGTKYVNFQVISLVPSSGRIFGAYFFKVDTTVGPSEPNTAFLFGQRGTQSTLVSFREQARTVCNAVYQNPSADTSTKARPVRIWSGFSNN